MDKQMERDHEQATAARQKYGNLAEHPAFCYTKSNTHRDMTSDRAVARVYRKLEGITEVFMPAVFGSTRWLILAPLLNCRTMIVRTSIILFTFSSLL